MNEGVRKDTEPEIKVNKCGQCLDYIGFHFSEFAQRLIPEPGEVLPLRVAELKFIVDFFQESKCIEIFFYNVREHVMDSHMEEVFEAVSSEVSYGLAEIFQEGVGEPGTLSKKPCCVDPAESQKRFTKVEEDGFYFIIAFLHCSNVNKNDLSDKRKSGYNKSKLLFI